MKKIIDFLENNLVEPQITGHDNIVEKTVNLNESAAISFFYKEKRFLSARLAIKNEVAESIDQDTRKWHDDPSISTIFYFNSHMDTIEVHPFDYETNARTCILTYVKSDSDDSIDIFEDTNNTNSFKQTGSTSIDAIIEALQNAEYTKLATGNIKSSSKQM